MVRWTTQQQSYLVSDDVGNANDEAKEEVTEKQQA